ncbi:unnamed protein product [Lactuca virosa]|uniref:CBS domain-containing protein n=1 Tax=Lactuca virosa TaxID=75947 RepID=A0AAU9NFP6_9ASTR|nr:unnamed protein product [Lactuca virosa]
MDKMVTKLESALIYQGSSVPPPPSLSDVGSSTSPNQSRQRSPANHVVYSNGGERIVKKLRLSKVLTMSDETSVLDVCRRMAARRVNVAIFTDADSLLCGIVTGKDIATKVVAEKLSPHQTIISKSYDKKSYFCLF